MREHIVFNSEFEERLKSGEKTQTIRYNWTHMPSEGDKVEALSDTGELWGYLHIDSIERPTIDEVVTRDLDGHRNYTTVEDCINHLSEFYSANFSEDTELILISYTFEKK